MRHCMPSGWSFAKTGICDGKETMFLRMPGEGVCSPGGWHLQTGFVLKCSGHCDSHPA